ncbi:hypothetical protein VPNG_04989 [Cytospora leucostoma]|uniref:Cytochrome P450 n=1 Tax=Cytospora leucostoma TaxID=1230097 RepID=A0A423X893_9PEZI|nr:hypothetical protein VPNG_04989 [Cytospora leucostoma]
MRDLCEEFADTEIFLMDFWPVYPPLYTVFGPEPINQICNKYNLPKTAVLSRFMQPVTGGPDLVTMNGDDWRYWRSLFNPGFSTGAMLNNVPHVVDSVLVFREKLVQMIGKGMFSLDEFTTKLTMEIILKVTLDDDSHYQKSPNILATALGRILSWHSFWDPRVLMHPFRPLIQRYNGNIINRYIRQELERRFQEIKAAHAVDPDGTQGKPKAIKSVTTLALEAYMAETQDLDILRNERLDERFAHYATCQIRLFLFAGTDATASIMVYVYHMLAKHPAWLRKLRDEHDQVFGQDPDAAAGVLKESPGFLNNCKLTVAFIKEVLRIYGPAGTMRSGLPGITVTDHQGNEQPMEYAGANILHQALHVNPRVWPRANEFLPERFLVGPEDDLHPDPAAYRPFEQGPRNCIGQTLVWNELRVAVILTCRDLEIRDAYDDYDAQRESELSVVEKIKRTLLGNPVKTVHGQRAYQTDSGGLHPANGYPCYVKWARGD